MLGITSGVSTATTIAPLLLLLLLATPHAHIVAEGYHWEQQPDGTWKSTYYTDTVSTSWWVRFATPINLWVGAAVGMLLVGLLVSLAINRTSAARAPKPVSSKPTPAASESRRLMGFEKAPRAVSETEDTRAAQLEVRVVKEPAAAQTRQEEVKVAKEKARRMEEKELEKMKAEAAAKRAQDEQHRAAADAVKVEEESRRTAAAVATRPTAG